MLGNAEFLAFVDNELANRQPVDGVHGLGGWYKLWRFFKQARRLGASMLKKRGKGNDLSQKKPPEGITVQLPTENSTPVSSLDEAVMLIHGEPKIGKTSLLANEPDAFFMEFDPPQKSLSIKQAYMDSWKTFKAYIDVLEAAVKSKKFPYKTGVVDGADIAYQLCFDYVCKNEGIKHPNDLGGYEGAHIWRAIAREFHMTHRRLLALPWAMRYICHSQWKEVKLRSGEKVEKLVPQLTGQASKPLIGDIDIWAAYVYDGDDRVLVIVGDEEIGAGHKFESHFRTPKGRKVREVFLGETASEAYANLVAAFNNEQTYTTIAEMRERQSKKGAKPDAKTKS